MINGRRVTIPEPRGRTSLPQIASRTEDLPADCDPTTTIYGRSITYFSVDIVANTSYRLLMIGIRASATDINEAEILTLNDRFAKILIIFLNTPP